jgi:CDP-glycerol glycerophosphotransferase
MRQLQRRLIAIVRFFWREANALLRWWWARLPVRDRTVLYESFAGNGAVCNPEAIFRELLSAPDMTELHHTWVLNRRRGYAALRSEFARNRRVRFVRRGSPSYFRALATRRYLVNNATFPPEFAKRPDQIYLNTWHGTPLKRMGYDMQVDGAIEAANTMRNFLSADFLVSQNAFMTEQLYEKAYRLRGVFTGRIIQDGYPRMDRQLLDDAGRAAARATLEAAGVSLGDRQLVLYAPTWRGSQFSSPDDNAKQIVAATRRLEELLGRDRYVVLLKTHERVHHFVARNPAWRSTFVPNDIPTNLLLGITDALVTDYSSIFFDYLPLAGPIVFYAQDGDAYSQTRGTYFSSDELPGPFCTDLEDVASAILEGAAGQAASRRRRDEWRARFVNRNDGHSARRVVDVVFRGSVDTDGILSIADDPRTSIVLHIGSMQSNGITSAALNLLGAIDPTEFDVSVVFARPASGGQPAANQERIPSHVRQFLRPASAESRLARTWRRLSFLAAQNPARRSGDRRRASWERQWRWVFGSTSFDHIIDFDGYGPFWANLMLNGPASTHSIWLHNDMAAEQHRIIRGKQRIRRSLGAVFALYWRFDGLVSVSGALRDLNRMSLGERLGVQPNAFLAARNVIDGQRVLTGAAAGLIETLGRPDETEPPTWLGELTDPRRTTRWFVSVGRLSTEKNHARLIRAFDLVHRARPEARLMIIGGGPLLPDLAALVTSRGLGDSVIMTGPLANPFPAVAASDCFVLSSDYEGQPMVIMEAAILRRPIVSVSFTTIRDALPDSAIHVVDRDDDALATGMLDFLDGKVTERAFDFVAYNTDAVAEFGLAIGAVTC